MGTLETKTKHAALRQDWKSYPSLIYAIPDGYSLHRDETTLRRFIQHHRSTDTNEVLSGPDGEPHWIEVDSTTYKAIVKSKTGIRDYSKEAGR